MPPDKEYSFLPPLRMVEKNFMVGGQRRSRYCCVMVPMKDAVEINGTYQWTTCLTLLYTFTHGYYPSSLFEIECSLRFQS
jgi:hypothetical protein